MTHEEIKVRDAAIVQRTLNGEAVKEITEAMGIKYGVVYRALVQAGVAPVKKYCRRVRTVPEVNVKRRKKRGRQKHATSNVQR